MKSWRHAGKPLFGKHLRQTLEGKLLNTRPFGHCQLVHPSKAHVLTDSPAPPAGQDPTGRTDPGEIAGINITGPRTAGMALVRKTYANCCVGSTGRRASQTAVSHEGLYGLVP